MVAANTKDFLELLKAMDAGGLRQVGYFLSHPRSAMIGFQARQQPTSHLDISYWSATPYLFGPGRAVKYIVRPCTPPKTTQPEHVTDSYLSDALRARLRQGEADRVRNRRMERAGRALPHGRPHSHSPAGRWRRGNSEAL